LSVSAHRSLTEIVRLGTLGLVALPPAFDRKLELPWATLLNGDHRVQGFAEGNSVPDIFVPQMIELYRAGRYPFDKINEAIAD